MPYRTRLYLPHLEVPEATYFITFRLAGTLPQNILSSIKEERLNLIRMAALQGNDVSKANFLRLKYLESRKIQIFLDQGIGDCFLRIPEIAKCVRDSLLHFDGSRYINHAFCVMPNHIHWILTPLKDSVESPLISIMHSIKSFTSHRANQLLQRDGAFWSKEYYDHVIRGSEEFERLVIYTLENPVKAGLCTEWFEWPWTVCNSTIMEALGARETRAVHMTIDELVGELARHGYIADRGLATTLYLLLNLRRPLLIEGHAGVGKTEAAKVLASMLQTELIRLQCYEGLDVNSAIYEWNYQKQLLAIKIQEGTQATVEEKEKHVFGPEFLLKRPLLRAITAEHASPVLLIDEIDRADEEFEAFLLEVLSDFQISIPEMQTIRATHIPYVILTSNRTRELSDALKRRCLFQWIDYPDPEKELQIVLTKMPGIEKDLASQIVRFIQQLRTKALTKPPGVAETLDWAAALAALNAKSLSRATVEETLGCILKSNEDIAKVQNEGIEAIISQ